MKVEGKKISTTNLVKSPFWQSIFNFFNKFTPDMRSGNQPDMPTTTNDRIWFLTENRFLFFTQGGPVEVTLKPSFVLAGILVCMAGVATIFYSTLIASYSAIEVIRDETIQTAQASIEEGDFRRAQPNLYLAEITNTLPHQIEGFYSTNDEDITKTRSYANPTSIQNQIPITQENLQSSPTILADDDDEMPMIISGGKRITLEKKSLKDNPKLFEEKLKLAQTSTATVVAKPMSRDFSTLPNGDIEDNSKIKETDTTLGQKKSLSIDSDKESPSLTERVRSFALASLPNFEAPTDLFSKNEQQMESTTANKPSELVIPKKAVSSIGPEEPETNLKNRPNTANKVGADTIIPPFKSALTVPKKQVLPLVTDAARNKKMLLSFEQEIDYIRSTFDGLGISAEALPTKLLSDTPLADNKFQNMMISLAEHRAALRKIPFKPPMLYFYISSDYGKRKHPKTGRTTFHHGIDLAGTWQENVRVTAPGIVVAAGSEGSFGKVVRIQHDFGITTVYAHLARITVKRGDYVSENHIIGKMGNTGKTAGAHLHYEIRVNGNSTNPNHFMKIGRQISVAGELRQSAFSD